MAQTFLIKSDKGFLRAWADANHDPTWTDVPSLAAHFDYQNADEACQTLQEIGFDTVVTDRVGRLATIEVIRLENNKRYADRAGIVLATDAEY